MTKGGERCRDLAQAIWVNEEIKRVIGIARDVDMSALNAMLMARRDTGRVAGFGVVSAELRRFGGLLGEDMAALGGMIHALVARVADLRKRARMQSHFQRAAEMDGHSRALLAGVLARQAEEMAEARARVEADKAALRLRLCRAMRLCDTGRVLSRNAVIEAVYAGAMAPTLSQVSRRAGESMEAVALSLLGLDVALGGEA